MLTKDATPEATQAECIADYDCETGENPLWHSMERKLYWTDIPAGRIFRYDPATGIHEQCYQGRPVGGFTVQSDGCLLLFMDRGTVANWRDGILTEVLAEIEDERNSRFNDVIADPRGRAASIGSTLTDRFICFSPVSNVPTAWPLLRTKRASTTPILWPARFISSTTT
jgi:sugar lactone lactonase YvrE